MQTVKVDGETVTKTENVVKCTCMQFHMNKSCSHIVSAFPPKWIEEVPKFRKAVQNLGAK